MTSWPSNHALRVITLAALLGICLLGGCPATEPEPGQDGAVDRDLGARDAGSADAGATCASHFACPQTWFCHDNKCVSDPNFKVFHCGKQDATGADTCPPGRPCVDKASKRSFCAESTSYPCQDACDCGPAHCCVAVTGQTGKRCVKDTQDPWRPGGTAIGGASCTQGQDPTYCATDPACHTGQQIFALKDKASSFLAYDPSTQETTLRCGGQRCFGTALNCASGQSCVDTVYGTLPPGKTCGRRSGGQCVSNAVAEAIFGFKPSDLLPPCSSSCPKGQPCDAGWVTDRAYAYARVVGTCGSCGNGACDPGEYPKTCPKDCSCGDGVCSPAEVGACAKDCGQCNNGKCDPWEFDPRTDKTSCPLECSCGNSTCDRGETVTSCPGDCSCGDGICSPDEACPQDCPCIDSPTYPEALVVCGDGVCSETGCNGESCTSCPADCGKCRWRAEQLLPGGLAAPGLSAIWGSSAADVWAGGKSGALLHYDGASWKKALSPATSDITSIWGSGPKDAWAVAGVSILHYDGTTWSKVPVSPAGKGLLSQVWGSSATNVYVTGGTTMRYDGTNWIGMLQQTNTGAIWGSSASDIWMVGQNKIFHWDGKAWTSLVHPAWPAYGVSIRSLWGSSASDVWAVGTDGYGYGQILHHDGKGWSKVSSQVSLALTSLEDVWGSSAADVWVVGRDKSGYGDGVILHYDGKSWTKATSLPGQELAALWGSGAKDVRAVGAGIFRYDGKAWTEEVGATASGNYLNRIWGTSDTDIWAVGRNILHYDGKSWIKTGAQALGSSTLEDLWGTSSSDVWAVGKGLILHYDGAAWSKAVTGSWQLQEVWASSSTDVWATGGGADWLHYDGKAWTTPATPAGAKKLQRLWGSGPKDLWAAGYELFHYDGSAWSNVTSAAPSFLFLSDIWGLSATEVWAAGQASGVGLVLRYDGKTWVKLPTPSSIPEAIHGASATALWLLGNSGEIERFDGKSWELVLPYTDLSYEACESLRTKTTGSNASGIWSSKSGALYVTVSPGYALTSVLRLKPLKP